MERERGVGMGRGFKGSVRARRGSHTGEKLRYPFSLANFRLLGRQPHRTIESDRFAVEVAIAEDAADEFGELG